MNCNIGLINNNIVDLSTINFKMEHNFGILKVLKLGGKDYCSMFYFERLSDT